MEKIKFPVNVDTRCESTTIFSYEELKGRIDALQHQKDYCPMDVEHQDTVMLEELELLFDDCQVYGYEE